MTQRRYYHQHPLHAYVLMLLVTGFLLVTGNVSFFSQVMQVYPFTSHVGFVATLVLVLFGVLLLLTLLLGYRYTLKAVLICLIMIAAIAGYFTDTYGTVYDTHMLQNALQTDAAETADLLNIKFILRVLLLGILPSWLIARQRIYFPSLKRSLLQRGGLWVLALTLIVTPIMALSGQYASFFREHKPLRFYTNPITPIYAVGKLANMEYHRLSRPSELIMHADDAQQDNHIYTSSSHNSNTQSRKPRLIVLVVGETSRADHIPFNGYARNTFPKLTALATGNSTNNHSSTPLSKGQFHNFSQVMACGTSTAYSVPCMFSYLGTDDYRVDDASYHENVLDTLHRLGVHILWRDNNSDAKGVMDKLPADSYQDYKSSTLNSICHSNPYQECRDVGMLVGLDEYVKQHNNQDQLIVLHQMGNHGPAYYKRYDAEFAKFSPTCHSNELASCDRDSLINAYDNALLATDDFLYRTVAWLQAQTDHDTAMLYVSDHGENLGEKGIYLHGMPNAFAPIEQRHVPAFLWLSDNLHMTAVDAQTPLSHDAITPTLLKLFAVHSQQADKPAFVTSISES